jgi:hypothetical protein
LFPQTLFTERIFPRGYVLPVPYPEVLHWRGGTDKRLIWAGGTTTGAAWSGTTVTTLQWYGAADEGVADVITLQWAGQADSGGVTWAGVDDHENRLGWAGVSDSRLTWVGNQVEGTEVQETNDKVRRQVPQLAEYTFQNNSGVIDLTPYATVKLLVKRDGALYDDVDGEFTLPKTGGEVYYDGYAFLTTGRWWVQFVAYTAGGVPLYGDELGFDVAPNLDDLSADEHPEP